MIEATFTKTMTPAEWFEFQKSDRVIGFAESRKVDNFVKEYTFAYLADPSEMSVKQLVISAMVS